MDLRNFDLNLLVVLHTLITERSVSVAANKLHLSQPATSAALKRLRVALGDRILVRDGLQMVLTPRAVELLAPIEAILGEIERTLTSPEPFDPANVDRTMRIATNDYGTFILIPPLMNRVELIAPNIKIEVWEIGRDAIAALKEGKIDLAIADAWTLKNCQCTEVLFTETFTCLARQNHPRIQGELTLDRYLAEYSSFPSRASIGACRWRTGKTRLGASGTVDSPPCISSASSGCGDGWNCYFSIKNRPKVGSRLSASNFSTTDRCWEFSSSNGLAISAH
jgi:DNA-binding transcriptional LysR family regulator